MESVPKMPLYFQFLTTPYASIAIQSKVNVIVLSRLLGHAEAETTLKYAHLGREDVCQAASHVSGVLVKGMRS